MTCKECIHSKACTTMVEEECKCEIGVTYVDYSEKENTPNFEQGWISVKDRLPELDEKVLTYDKWGHMRDRVYRAYGNGKPYFTPDGLEAGTDIKYWMPLPEPPEVGG